MDEELTEVTELDSSLAKELSEKDDVSAHQQTPSISPQQKQHKVLEKNNSYQKTLSFYYDYVVCYLHHFDSRHCVTGFSHFRNDLDSIILK